MADSGKDEGPGEFGALAGGARDAAGEGGTAGGPETLIEPEMAARQLETAAVNASSPHGSEKSKPTAATDLIDKCLHWFRPRAVWLNAPVTHNLKLNWLLPGAYPWVVMPLATLILLGLVFGPGAFVWSSPRAILGEAFWPAVWLTTAGFGLLCLVNVASHFWVRVRNNLIFWQVAVLIGVCGVIYTGDLPFFDGSTFPGYFRNLPTTIGHVAIFVLAVCLLVCRGLAVLLFPGPHATEKATAVRERLLHTELFRPRVCYLPDHHNFGPIAFTLFVKLLTHIPQVVFPSAVLYLISPDDDWWQPRVWITLFFTFVLYTANSLDERSNDIFDVLNRLFFRGPQLIISVVVLAVAYLRAQGNHYVGYLFNLGEGQVSNPNLLAYFLFAYVLAWFYGFWSAHFLSRRLIRLLAGRARGPVSPKIAYQYEGKPRVSAAQPKGRFIRLHGADHFEITGKYFKEEVSEHVKPIQHVLSPSELLLALWQREDSIGAVDSQVQRSYCRDLYRSARIYPAICTILALGAIVGLGLAVPIWGTLQPPQLALRYQEPPLLDQRDLEAGLVRGPNELTGSGAIDRLHLVDLADLLETRPAGSDPCRKRLESAGEPRIAIAASGGGTRAAIFTASVLHGLAEVDRICNVIMASGVSGGSAALGYFAIHSKDLRRPEAYSENGPRWSAFLDAMAHPFIQDVIREASALRISFGSSSWSARICDEPDANTNFGNDPSGWPLSRSRLGHLLAEGFACSMGGAAIGDLPFVLMLNTSLLGRFNTADADCGQDETNLPRRIRACRKFLLGDGVGGRLVISNREGMPLSNGLVQPSNPCSPATSNTLISADDRTGDANGHEYTSDPQQAAKGMDIVEIAYPSAPIARAAALSANFPPVFPDAAIDISCSDRSGTGTRYWVTDGGAVENRGTLTMLLAIEQSLNRLKELKKAEELDKTSLAPLHLVVADVSRDAGAYEESLGFGSVLNAGTQLGLQIEAEVIGRIAEIYRAAGQTFRIHEIQMPPVFRNGGIGTHWMLPASLIFKKPAGNLAREPEDGIPAQVSIGVAPARASGMVADDGSVDGAANEAPEEIELSPAEVRAVIRGLHSQQTHEFTGESKYLNEWAQTDPQARHGRAWKSLMCWLGGAAEEQKKEDCE